MISMMISGLSARLRFEILWRMAPMKREFLPPHIVNDAQHVPEPQRAVPAEECEVRGS